MDVNLYTTARSNNSLTFELCCSKLNIREKRKSIKVFSVVYLTYQINILTMYVSINTSLSAISNLLMSSKSFGSMPTSANF